ncbi:MAG: PAS domain S-box protein [Deltaproteobacteria bacterium]|nr:PAS domain S-box protein [Deltaproteobacteria bacterium]
MNKEKTTKDEKTEFRKQAEAELGGRPDKAEDLSPEAKDRLLHELRIHQIELEMQNDELRRSQLELEAARDKYSDLYDFAPVGYFSINEKGMISAANLTGSTMLGVERGSLIGSPFSHFIHMDDQDIYYHHRKVLLETKTPRSCELRLKRRDGSEFWAQLQCIVVRDGESGFDLIQTTVSNIDERKQAEEALRESEERYRTVADFTYDWEYWIAPDRRVLYVSPSCERITGYGPDEFVNDPDLLERVIHPDDRTTVVDHLGKEQSLEKLPSLDFRIITRSGEERWLNHVCQPVFGADRTYLGRRAGNRDITQRKQVEEELLKAKKLESLGVFAGGIAHDFNNLMFVVEGYISLAREEMQPGSEGYKGLIEAEKASLQTRELTSRLITFSDGGGPFKETVSLGDLVRNSVAHSMKGSDIDARFSIPDDISPIEADEPQIRQVIHNVVINAREAMAGQGTIHVFCENASSEKEDRLTLRKGKYVKISIEDQGPGIPEEDRERIFDPYFSTKEMGIQKGMGLGLAVSDSIVKQHDGLITVKSELGAGAILSIYLPASEKEIVEAAPVKEPVAKKPVTRSGKILVMDDEEMVRNATAAMLGHMGYVVEVAVDGVEAIEMYKGATASGKAYDAVILELTNSTGMGGVETIKKLLQIDPDVKAIVTSGYSNDPVLTHFRKHGFRGFIERPYMQKDLDEAIMGLF